MHMGKDRRQSLRFVGWFFLCNTLIFWLVGSIYLEKILLSPSLFENSMANYATYSGKIFVVAFAIINYLVYIMLLAYIPALLIATITILIPKKGLVWFLCTIFGTLSLVLLIVNNTVFSMFKFHLNLSILSMLFTVNAIDVFEPSSLELIMFFGMVGLILVVEIAVGYFVWCKIIKPEKFFVGKTIGIFWLGGFLFSYLTLMLSIDKNNNLFSQQTPKLPLYNQLLVYLIPDENAADILYRYSEEHFSQPIYSDEKMDYPLNPMVCKKPENPPNIILIMVDSLRFDSLKKHMPYLNNFARKSWQFDNHLSGGNATQPGLFSIFYSLPSNYWTAALENQVAPVFIQLLNQFGYSSKVVWSSEMVNPPFHKTIYNGISGLNLDSAPGNDIGNRDRYVTKQAIQYFKTIGHKQPFFINLFYGAPHGYCKSQSYPTPYQPALKRCLRIAMTNSIDARPLYNRYLNAVSFIDNELKKVLDSIAEQGYLKNSIVIITSDHGQEFNDNKQNYWGHAGNFTRAQVQVPLIIYWPNKAPRKIQYLTSSYDIIPTLLQRVFHCQNNPIDYSIGQDLLVESNRLPFILSGSYSNLALIESDRLMTLRTSGQIFIRNLKAEPQPNAKPRMKVLRKALKLMRLYYLDN